ncbi:hypothetical protein E8E13_004534 [Curvularia kusanoi]|uniref:Uncharacterized protein n=1 Tax=Curvularia kusanoi TaxID=90978 RepID=A0A9P4W585_CURKU|nr:hypothetical protein E8E13_004534 [Curvularia kusanoi]
MALFQRRRPTPIDVFVIRTKRQAAGLGAAGPGSSDAPKSPDSPASSAGASSPSDSSDSEDDEPKSPKSPKSPKKSSQSSTTSQAPPTTTSTAAITSSSSKTKSPPSSPTKSSQPSSIATTTSSPSSSTAFTLVPTSQGIAAVAPPPPVVTDPSTSTFTSIPTSKATSSRPSSTASPFTPSPPTSRSSQVFSSKIARPTQSASNTASGVSSRISGIPVAEDDPPHRTHPEPPTLMSKGAEAAAITLSIIGAIIIAVCIFLYCKRRRRQRAARLDAELERDAQNYVSSLPSSTSTPPNPATGAHMTQISSRSNTLFGAGPYTRPETVTTNHDSAANSHPNHASIPLPQPTPNPFADPPLNKAYDVLAGRPRSTTLTDRGSQGEEGEG